jgi:hypothetical protein
LVDWQNFPFSVVKSTWAVPSHLSALQGTPWALEPAIPPVFQLLVDIINKERIIAHIMKHLQKQCTFVYIYI